MNDKPLIVENIEKSFGGVRALRGVSLQLEPGQIYGLIGPDGAGKTTLMRIIVTLLKADAGSVWFLGRNAARDITFVRRNIGYMPQRFSLYPDLTVEENLRFFGDLFGVQPQVQAERLQKLYRFSRLGPFKKRMADALSGGMKQKLALSCMLIHEPAVMIMDEPTYGVDPVSRAELWDILKELAADGKTILVSTAYMDEALLCDHVALIFKGKVLASGRPQALIRSMKQPLYLIKTQNAHGLYHALQKLFAKNDFNLFGEGVHLFDRQNLGMDHIRRKLKENHFPFDLIKPIEPNIEDIFLNLIHQHGDGE
ncbi:ABC transporter related protein [Caldithrix abyssi DSM 13497]|uniref:ABC transporter related protein n=1 Tax=Caldithrix abyssi DSM 13497 TaxID=880073 RepID=H1XYR1_CALAY|nr:ABC transporter ATP-binding protein [Caldithrix abyssi]APF20559.1 ABC-2 type transport system ATP-binding protein [Caldithrix abyssi DSM 13497]EHO40930.1 ABC transporter related protein [Caldithrix abyssi DSM 13497]